MKKFLPTTLLLLISSFFVHTTVQSAARLHTLVQPIAQKLTGFFARQLLDSKNYLPIAGKAEHMKSFEKVKPITLPRLISQTQPLLFNAKQLAFLSPAIDPLNHDFTTNFCGPLLAFLALNGINEIINETKDILTLSILETAFKNNTFKDLGWNINGNGYTLLHGLPQDKRDLFILSILETAFKNNTFKDLGWECNNAGFWLLYFLSRDKKNAFLEPNVLHAIEHHDYNIISILLIHVSQEKKSLFFPSIQLHFEPLLQTHHYNLYFEKCFEYIVKYGIFKNLCSHPSMLEILHQLAEFTTQETEKENIVLCHGQADQWAFFQNIYRALRAIETKQPFSDDFIALRFNNETNLDQTTVQSLRTHGVKDYTKDRFNILFTTMVPFQNHPGSNSYLYAAHNSDVTTNAGRYTGTLLTIFEDNGMKEEFEYVQKNHPYFFDKLEKSYKDANADQGNYGNLIAFSLPSNLANTLAYPTRWDGEILPIIINEKPETRMSEIVKHFDQVSKELEIALILAPEILDPNCAAAAGVKIRYFGPMITTETEKYMKFKQKLAEIMTIVKQHYDARIADKATKKN